MGLESLVFSLLGMEEPPSFAMKCALLLGLTFVGLSLYLTALYCFHQLKLRRFQGPFAVPLLGNCYTPAVVASLFKFLSYCRKNYGRVFRVFLFHTPFIVVADPAIVRRVLSDTKTFPKGEKYTKIFGIIFGGGLVTSTAEKHKADKALFGKYFIRSSVSKLIPSMNHHALRGIDEFITSKIDDGEKRIFDCEQIFSRLSLRVFMNFAFDFDLTPNKAEETDVCNTVSRASYSVGSMIAFNTPNWPFLPVVRTLKEFPKKVMEFTQPRFDKREKSLADGSVLAEEKNDLMTMMIQNNFSKQDITDHVTTLVGAGHDTTAYFASYVCYCLGQYPECQEKVRQCVLEVMGDREEVTADDITNMKYLHLFLHETLRFFAVVPFLVRKSAHEFVYKNTDGSPDIVIPANTEIMIPLFLLNRDPSIWENPTEFNPMRWEGKGEYTSAKDGFFPFGYGVRVCIGNLLAQLEVAVFISQLIRQYEVYPDPDFKLNILAGISLTTSNGVKVRFKKL